MSLLKLATEICVCGFYLRQHIMNHVNMDIMRILLNDLLQQEQVHSFNYHYRNCVTEIEHGRINASFVRIISVVHDCHQMFSQQMPFICRQAELSHWCCHLLELLNLINQYCGSRNVNLQQQERGALFFLCASQIVWLIMHELNQRQQVKTAGPDSLLTNLYWLGFSQNAPDFALFQIERGVANFCWPDFSEGSFERHHLTHTSYADSARSRYALTHENQHTAATEIWNLLSKPLSVRSGMGTTTQQPCRSILFCVACMNGTRERRHTFRSLLSRY